MNRICRSCLLVVLLASLSLINVGCSANAPPVGVGAARGAAVGAIAGQAMKRNTKSTLIGAGAGALGGAILNDGRRRGW